MLLKLAHHIIRHQAFCQIQMLRLKIKHKPCCRCWRFLHEVLHTADVHVCCFCVLPLRAIQAMCLFWAEALCSFPLCCPHTLWQAASCCLTSCPSDTNVPSAHQGVHNQLRERSPCSSLSLSFFFLCLPHCVSRLLTHTDTHNLSTVTISGLWCWSVHHIGPNGNVSTTFMPLFDWSKIPLKPVKIEWAFFVSMWGCVNYAFTPRSIPSALDLGFYHLSPSFELNVRPRWMR